MISLEKMISMGGLIMEDCASESVCDLSGRLNRNLEAEIFRGRAGYGKRGIDEVREAGCPVRNRGIND